MGLQFRRGEEWVHRHNFLEKTRNWSHRVPQNWCEVGNRFTFFAVVVVVFFFKYQCNCLKERNGGRKGKGVPTQMESAKCEKRKRLPTHRGTKERKSEERKRQCKRNPSFALFSPQFQESGFPFIRICELENQVVNHGRIHFFFVRTKLHSSHHWGCHV